MMGRNIAILLMLTTLFMVSCDELPLNFGGNEIVASVGKNRLYAKDLRTLDTEGLSAEDSLAKVAIFTEKWVHRAVKLREAERVFTSSANDIDKMVEEYRQSLLIRKLDQYTIDQRDDTSETESQIAEYYKSHAGQFKLERDIVKGYIIKIPRDYKNASELIKKMTSWKKRDSLDVVSLIEKNDFERVSFESDWVDYGQFLDCLPVARGASIVGVYIARKGIQELKDSEFHYLFEFSDVLRKGDTAPLEQTTSAISKILRRQRQSLILEQADTQLYNAAIVEGVVVNHAVEALEELRARIVKEGEDPQKEKE